MAPTPLFQDPASPYSPPSFTHPFRPRNRDDGGRHMQTLIQQISKLTIDDYESPQGDHHRQEQRFVQTTTTTIAQPTWMTKQPYNTDARFLPSPASSPYLSATRSPKPAKIHDCCSTYCSDFSSTAAKTAANYRYSKPGTSSKISEVSSGFGTGGASSPSSNSRYLRTRRGAISGPACPGPDHGFDSTMTDAPVMDSRAPAPDGQPRLLLPALGAPRSVISSDFSGRSRAGSITTATRPTNRMNEARLLLPSPSNGWIDHDRNSVASSSNSRSTVRPPFSYAAPPPPSSPSFSRASARRSSQYPLAQAGEITPNDSISQAGESPASAWSPPTAWRVEGKQPPLSLPGRSLPLQGVRHVPASEVGARLSPHVRPQQENNGWILPSSTPGRFGPPPHSAFGAGSSRDSFRREFS